MDGWSNYVKLSCVTCGIIYSLSLLFTPILKVKIKQHLGNNRTPIVPRHEKLFHIRGLN